MEAALWHGLVRVSEIHHSDQLDAYLAQRDELLRIARRLVGCPSLAEDLVQDSWVKWSRAKYSPGEAKPVLRRIVSNLSIDWHRRQQREKRRDVDYRTTLTDSREYWPDAERVVVARQDLRRVVAALSKLPKRTLFALRLYSVEERTYREIGTALGVSHVAAFKIVAQALAKAAAALEG